MVTKTKDRLLPLILAGGVSGVFSGLPIVGLLSPFTPGLNFGIAVGLYYYLHNLKSWKIIPFIIGSAASYIVAYYIAMYMSGDSWNFTPLALVAGGGIGTFLLLLVFNFTIAPLKLRTFIILFLLGSITSLSYNFTNLIFDNITPNPNSSFSLESVLLFFTIWQAVMAGGLGWAAQQNKKKKASSKK